MSGGEGRQSGEQMDSFSAPCCIVSTSTLSPSSSLYLLPVALPQFFTLTHFSTRVFLLSLFFFHHPVFFFSLLAPSFTLCCLVADGSVGQQQQHQQQQQSRSQSVSRRWGEEKGVVERGGGGERRWGSGIWRAWLRGPLRGSVRVRVVV